MQEVLARHGHRDLQQVAVVYQTTRGIARRNPTRGAQVVNHLTQRGGANRNLPGTKERLNFVSTHKTLLFGINVSEGSDDASCVLSRQLLHQVISCRFGGIVVFQGSRIQLVCR